MVINRQAVVLSFAGGAPYSPRAQRARILAATLERELSLSVERIPAPGQPYAVDAGVDPAMTLPRHVTLRLLRPVLLDALEFGARRSLRGWAPDAAGAILIGWPFSPLYHAARRLVSAGVPYVVDVGDPWALTAKPATAAWMWGRAFGRARAAESFVWRHAAGGVVTTRTQEAALRGLFPDLALLCRPNGYFEVGVDDPRPQPRRGAERELVLVQFGSVYRVRVPIGEWLSRLRREGGFERLRFVNYGHLDAPQLVEADDPLVVVESSPPVEWETACRVAAEADGAVVVGNRDPAQLPSKAIQYLTLPIPRLALTGGRPGDELARFAEARPGFLAVDVASDEGPSLALAHLRRAWPEAALRPPASDSWAAVARELAEFANDCWGARGQPGGEIVAAQGAGAGSAMGAGDG